MNTSRHAVSYGIAALASVLLFLSSGPAPAVQLAGQEVELRQLGGKSQPGLLNVEDGSWAVTGKGREAYWDSDDGTFAGIRTDAPNFILTARIAAVEGETPNPKFGLALRNTLAGNARTASLRYDGYEENECLQWFARFESLGDMTAGGRQCFNAGLLRDWSEKTGLWLRIVRRYPFVRFEASRDGQEWTELPVNTVLLDQELWAGLQVTAGGSGNKPVTVTFDHVDFRVDASAGNDLTAKKLGYGRQPEPLDYRMYLVRVDAGAGELSYPHTAFIVKPDSLAWKDVRAAVVSAGSKEITFREGGGLEYHSEGEGLRRPVDMDGWEGVYDLPPLPAMWDAWGHYGVVRVGGVSAGQDYAKVLEKLAGMTGTPHIEYLAGMPTGHSFAGGRSYQFAASQPERTIAAAPVIIGIAGEMGNERTRQVPMMHFWGSIDGSHFPGSMPKLKPLRKADAKWASAPMFGLAHFSYNSDALIYPFFLEMLERRMPADWDGRSLPELRKLQHSEGWIGILDGAGKYEAPQNPKIMPAKEYTGGAEYPVWLPNGELAHYWRHFVAAQTSVRLAFPTYNHSSGFSKKSGFASPKDVTARPAGEPTRIVASGPLGDDVTVRYYVDAEPLKPEWTHPDNPYHLVAPALPAGLHVFTMEVRKGDMVYLSRPVTIMFHPTGKRHMPSPAVSL